MSCLGTAKSLGHATAQGSLAQLGSSRPCQHSQCAMLAHSPILMAGLAARPNLRLHLLTA